MMITPINIMPSVEPITDVTSRDGAGVVCNATDAAVSCAAAGSELKFASASANAMKNKATQKI